MNFDRDIITVRPSETIDTIQKLPNYVGISGKTAGANGISMNIVDSHYSKHHENQFIYGIQCHPNSLLQY